jgi:hypothetical protein
MSDEYTSSWRGDKIYDGTRNTSTFFGHLFRAKKILQIL